MEVRMRRVLFLLALIFLVTGCGKHYWSRQGASVDDFARDSQECAQAVAISTSSDKTYGIVRADYYKTCMKSRNWVRAQHPEPVPKGWYRGFEDDEIVKLDALPRQPEVAVPTPTSDLPPCERGVTSATMRNSQGQLRCRP
jgi:hypothetical protein